MKRSRTNRRVDKRVFRSTSKKTLSANRITVATRGGTRL